MLKSITDFNKLYIITVIVFVNKNCLKYIIVVCNIYCTLSSFQTIVLQAWTLKTKPISQVLMIHICILDNGEKTLFMKTNLSNISYIFNKHFTWKIIFEGYYYFFLWSLIFYLIYCFSFQKKDGGLFQR